MFHIAPNLWLKIDFSRRIHLDLAIISLVLYLPTYQPTYKGVALLNGLQHQRNTKFQLNALEHISFKTPLTSEPSNDTKIAHHQRTSLFFSTHPPVARAPRSKLRQPVDRHLYPIPQPQTSEYEGLGWNTDGLFGGILSWWFMSNNPHKSLGV